MQDQIDLHIHSNKSSDGDFSPFHIIYLAQEKKMRAISISDHDTVAAYPEALRYGEKAGVEVIPSIELTTIFHDREFHLLLPFINWEKDIIFEMIEEVTEKRYLEAKERIRKLQEIGYDISWKEVAKLSGSNPPLGVTIAQFILEKAENMKTTALKKYLGGTNRLFAPYLFYKDYFMEGKPAYVPKQNLSLLRALELAPQTEGVPVLAHPGAYFQKTTKEDLVLLKEKGLKGLEVYTSYHNPSQTEHYRKIAEELDLVPTAGSDFHGRIKPHIPFGSLKNGGYWIVEKLRERKG